MAVEVDLVPSMLLERTCRLTVDTEEYEDAQGVTRTRNVVPFAGYDRDSANADDDDLPF